MMERDWSSPFGGRGISAAAMAAEKGLRTRQRALRDAGGAGPSNEGHVADKWQLLRALTVGRAAFGVSDRALAVLNALLSFHPGKGLGGASPAIVFPSNRELSLRALGMAPATLRRHLASLVEAGLVLRRDSPNGKRYRRLSGEAGQGGQEESFGFDLSPLALRAPRIFAEQERCEAEAREIRRLRTAITLVRRDAAKVLEAAFAEARSGPFQRLYAEMSAMALPRRSAASGAGELRVLLDRQTRLCAEVESAYLSGLSEQEVSASDAKFERHILNSNPETFESDGHRQNSAAKPSLDIERPGGGGEPEAAAEPASRRAPERRGFDLGTVLRVCPDIADYATAPITSLGDLCRAAETVRAALGISPSAYEQAREVMGEGAAAVVIAAMLQRATHIRSPGGYLRRLTDKTREGTFGLGPMLKALES